MQSTPFPLPEDNNLLKSKTFQTCNFFLTNKNKQSKSVWVIGG